MLEAMKQAMEALEVEQTVYLRTKLPAPEYLTKAIASLRQAMAELESQEPDYWLGYGLQAYTEKPFENATALYTHPPQRTWVGLMRGVRVEGDTVVISVHYGNDAARQVCGALIEEMNT